jgi:colicin import membrane protein
MIRKHESSVSFKAGALAIAVHVLLLVAMIMSVNWKAAHAPMVVTEVELWDKLPAPSVSKHKSIAPPVVEPKVKEEPKPVVKDVVEPAPKPVVVEPSAKPETAKADIALEIKKKELEKKELEKKELEKKEQDKQAAELKQQKEEKRKQDLEKLQKSLRDEALKSDDADEKARKDATKELQKAMRADDLGTDDRKASAASQGVVDEYVSKIQAKIRGNVNKTLCADVVELSFKVDILPTGDVSGMPRLTKSSGSSACDSAVERAIMASQPLPLPAEPAAKVLFRNLNLKFKPNT